MMMATVKKSQKYTTIVVDGEETIVQIEHLTLAQHLISKCENLNDSNVFFSIVKKIAEQGVVRKTAIQICKYISTQLLNQKKGQE